MAGRVAYYGGIVKDGLVLNLDAAKRDSYPTTGTTWRDISGNQNNGTLTNGPTFNSDNGGSFVFDGTNDFSSGNNITNLFTDKVYASVFYKLTTTGNYPMTLTVGTAPSDTEGFSIRHQLSTSYPELVLSTSGTTTSVVISTVPVLNTIVCIGLLYNGTTIKMYKNGVFTGNAAAKTGNIAFGASPIYRIGARQDGYYFGGNVYSTQIYNRALSDTEILQNYNATKGRYGL